MVKFAGLSRLHVLLALVVVSSTVTHAQSLAPIPAFPLNTSGPVISRPIQATQPFTVAGEHGVLLGMQDGTFESWILPVKLLSHLTIEAQIEGYSVPIAVNPQAAQVEVRPDHTTITYTHTGFTLRQIMFSPNQGDPATGPIVLFQIDAIHPVDLTFRFIPEMRWMWPRRSDGSPSPDWVALHEPGSTSKEGFYVLGLDYPDLAGAVTIPTALPGILAPYQERPQEHPTELKLHYDPKRDGDKYFPLLMAVGASAKTASVEALRESLEKLNASIPAAYKAHAAGYEKLLAESTSISTPDKALNEAFSWGVASIEQLKAHEYTTQQTALVAGYYESGDSARPGFGWFFGRDSLYSLYAVNGFGDFALTRDELNFLIERQRSDGKIMHEYSQTAADPSVNWKSFEYMYAAADATPLFLMAVRDYLRASGDVAFLQKNKGAIEKAWAFETAPTSDTDHDGIYDNSQGTGWVESWPGPNGKEAMPHQEVYMALLDEQASQAYAAMASALGDKTQADAATARAAKIKTLVEQEYYDPAKDCYAFSHNLPNDPNGVQDKTSTIYPAVAWWDYNASPAVEGSPDGARSSKPMNQSGEKKEPFAPEGSLSHPNTCLAQWAAPTIDTDWGTRDVANNEKIYDGMSYHQGSVWPLFTGWGALAEYRANQPLAGQQLLMQNVDLTWAQDLGAVTELLSGDFFVPMGRSTSHQLWSSAMVITPTLRGLFGINLDAATNTITVNPHLPAEWDQARVDRLHIGDYDLSLTFHRDKDVLRVSVADEPNSSKKTGMIRLRSDVEGARSLKSNSQEIDIPLPSVEVSVSGHELSDPGSRTEQLKILSTTYEKNRLKIKVAAPAGSKASLTLLCNDKQWPSLKLAKAGDQTANGARLVSASDTPLADYRPHRDSHLPPQYLNIDFPQGQGWQTLEFTLSW